MYADNLRHSAHSAMESKSVKIPVTPVILYILCGDTLHII